MFAREGVPYIAVPLTLGVIALVAFDGWLVASLLLFVGLFMALFFRRPRRIAPSEREDEVVVVAPADGRVTRVGAVDPTDTSSPVQVSIFLSVFDVHINRAPIRGTITDIAYTKGRFRLATREDASLVNEQNQLTIRGERVTVVCRQVAGILARRIICWKQPGDTLGLGEEFGLIKFSSRTDLIMPPEVEVMVKVGMRVRGGVSIIGRIR